MLKNEQDHAKATTKVFTILETTREVQKIDSEEVYKHGSGQKHDQRSV